MIVRPVFLRIIIQSVCGSYTARVVRPGKASLTKLRRQQVVARKKASELIENV